MAAAGHAYGMALVCDRYSDCICVEILQSDCVLTSCVTLTFSYLLIFHLTLSPNVPLCYRIFYLWKQYEIWNKTLIIFSLTFSVCYLRI